MKIFKPFLLKKYGKYFESDEVFINKILINNVKANTYPVKLIDLFVDTVFDLDSIFYWHESVEGAVFWSRLYNNKLPIMRKDI